MTEFTVKLADTPMCIRALHPQMKGFLREYLSEEKPELVIETKQEDIERERREDLCTREREGLPRQNAGDAYLETLAIYRQLAEKLAERNVLLFHGSALAMDGEAYLFAARSGTGKSTHARLWREAFGERVVMINDDKPLLQVGEEGVRVFGTPWNGKHRLGNNASAPLKALCFLERDSGNRIERIGLGEAFPLMLQQCYLPENLAGAQCVLAMLEKLGRNVKLYRLGCNMEADAALVSYRGMQEENRMKLKTGFITHTIGGEQMMVATGPASGIFHGLVRSNETAAFIVDCLKKETTEREIVEAMLQEYDAPEDVIAGDVHRIVEQLREIGALE